MGLCLLSELDVGVIEEVKREIRGFFLSPSVR